MKNYFIIALILIAAISCKKEDYREKFVNSYNITVIKNLVDSNFIVLTDTTIGTIQTTIDNTSKNKMISIFSSNIDFSKIDGIDAFYTHEDFRENILRTNISIDGKIDYQPTMDCAVTNECLFGIIKNDSINLSYWYNPHNLSIQYKIKGENK